jgi:hypothetical protein
MYVLFQQQLGRGVAQIMETDRVQASYQVLALKRRFPIAFLKPYFFKSEGRTSLFTARCTALHH